MQRISKPDRDSPVLIVEPNSEGHRLYYVRLLIDECDTRGRKVTVLTTSEAVRSEQWQVHLGQRYDRLEVQVAESFGLVEISRTSAKIGASVTILPEGDLHLLPLLRHGWTGTGTLNVLVVRPEAGAKAGVTWTQPVRSFVKQVLIWAADRRPHMKVFALRSPLAKRRMQLRWVPDPVTLTCTQEDRKSMRATLGAEGNRYWFGIFGAISRRKNVPLVLQAITDQPNVGLLLAGSLDPQVAIEIEPLIERFVANGGKIFFLPGTVSEVEFDSAIAAVDCVIAAHSNEGPSGVLLKAASAGTQLLVAGAQSLRRDAESLGEQAIWAPLELSALTQAIGRLRSSKPIVRAPELGSSAFQRALTSGSI